MIVNGTNIFVGLSVLIAFLSAALTVAVIGLRSQARQRQYHDTDLTDGAVLIAESGVVIDASREAEAMFGPLHGQPTSSVLQGMFDNPAVMTALGRLEQAGEALHLLAQSRDGRHFELSGQPRGGQLRIIVRDASFIQSELARAQALAAEHARELKEASWERTTLATVLTESPLIIWNRQLSGAVNWSAGKVVTRGGAVTAEQVVQMMATRGGLPRTSGQTAVEKSRIEVTATGGVGTLPLQVVELPGPGANRVGFAVDATIASAAERTLTRFVQTMTETFAHLTVGLAIFDRNQTLALFNPALVQMWQVDPAWLSQRPSLREIIDSLRASRRIPEVADFHKFRAQLLALFDNPETVDYEGLWHLDDGSNVRVLARPHPHGALAFIFDDVSERMRLEQRYRHLVDLRRATLNSLDEGLVVFGPDGILQFANQAFHDTWDIEPESIAPSIHARDLIGLCQGLTVETDAWRRLIGYISSDEARRAWSARLTLGSGRALSARFAPLPDGSTMAVFTDVTESERIALALSERNEALEAAEEMRGAVLDQISHRLRTPLNTIFGFGQLLNDPRFGDLSERQRDYARGILEAAGHLLDTIDDVTELASLQIERGYDDAAELILDDTLALTRQLLDKRGAEAGVALSVTPSGIVEPLQCDPVRIRQIVFNLASAAIERCGSGGRVHLTARAQGAAAIEIVLTEYRPAAAQARGAQRPDQGLVMNALALSLIRRMVLREGGSIDIREGEEPGDFVTVCRLEGMRLADADPTGPVMRAIEPKVAAPDAVPTPGDLDRPAANLSARPATG